MTSASELFYSRRSRLGRKAAALDLRLDPSASSSNCRIRNCSNHRRREHHHRHDFSDGCNPFGRISGGHRSLGPLSHSDHLPARLEQATVHSVSSNSLSPEMPRSIRNRTNQGLPGAVLLARERLLERLRGLSLSENRQSGRGSLGISHDPLVSGNDFRPVNAANWGPEISSILSVRGSPLPDLSPQADGAQFLQVPSKKKPPGLTKMDMHSLHFEVFRGKDKDMKGMGSIALQDCSVCLENFLEGDELIYLPCGHRFHSACLNPWLRTCGDCPYCRHGIV